DGIRDFHVTGVQTCALPIYRLGRALLHDSAFPQHDDAGGDLAHHGEVVADEQVTQSETLAQVHEEVQHLRLHRDVERGDRLVGEIGRASCRERVWSAVDAGD